MRARVCCICREISVVHDFSGEEPEVDEFAETPDIEEPEQVYNDTPLFEMEVLDGGNGALEFVPDADLFLIELENMFCSLINIVCRVPSLSSEQVNTRILKCRSI